MTVHVTSTTEPAGETVTIPGANGVYTGTIAAVAVHRLGRRRHAPVSNGDVITATYIDASPVATLVATAAVDS